MAEAPKKSRKNLVPEEKVMIKNIFDGLRKREQNLTQCEVVTLCSILTKVSERTIYTIIKTENEEGQNVSKQDKKMGRKKRELDDDMKYAIRRIIHGFYFRNEIPNLKKIALSIEADETFPRISRHLLRSTLRCMNFRYLKRSRNSALLEKDEIVLWRRKYLKRIREYREEGRKIYYTDETWVNEGHTVGKVWQDLEIKSKRQAFLEGFSTGLKAPTGKGRRLIITHVGSDSGFLEGGLSVFESRKTGDYHEDMDAERFEKWFSNILPQIEPGSVVVMDNAPYHSRRVEQLPTSAWRKGRISEWLSGKNIPFDNTMLKIELLNIARLHKNQYIKYAVDEMASERGVIVLRLPPYHCELNPIELIWGQIKNEVARKNTTFKLDEVKVLLNDAIGNVLPDSWKKCILHVMKEEQRMWELDTQIDITVEPVIITISQNDSSSSDVSSSDSDYESVP